MLSSSNGPVIHDVTDIDEASADLIELPNEDDELEETDDMKDGSPPYISEIFSTDLPISLDVATHPAQIPTDNNPDNE